MIFPTYKFFVLFQLQSLLKCEDAINHFTQKDLKFKAIKQFLSAIRETAKILEEPYVVTKLLQGLFWFTYHHEGKAEYLVEKSC